MILFLNHRSIPIAPIICAHRVTLSGKMPHFAQFSSNLSTLRRSGWRATVARSKVIYQLVRSLCVLGSNLSTANSTTTHLTYSINVSLVSHCANLSLGFHAVFSPDIKLTSKRIPEDYIRFKKWRDSSMRGATPRPIHTQYNAKRPGLSTIIDKCDHKFDSSR